MTKVDLDKIGVDIDHRREAILWLLDKYGPAGDAWTVDKLTYVKFENDRDATLFILRWA